MTRTERASFFLASLPMLFLVAADAWAASNVEVNTCGQVLEGSGYLAADLDCSGENLNEHTVVLGRHATLNLGGFTLKGRTTSSSDLDGFTETVACSGSCAIVGPGTIVGSAVGPASVVGFTEWEEGRRIEVIDATITGGDIGVTAHTVDLSGATITANRSVGVWAFLARIDDSAVTNNGLDLDGFVRIGVFGQVKSRVRNSTVTGNGMGGVEGWRVRLDDTTATGNDAYADCATKICADVSSRFAMRVIGSSVCHRSVFEGTFADPGSYIGQPLPAMGEVQNWGVCALD
jgi:hypothetical protein